MGAKTAWRSYLNSLQRFRVDSRARGHVVRWSFLALYLAACAYFYLALLPHQIEGGAAIAFSIYGLVGLLGLVGYLAVKKIGGRDQELLHVSITGQAPQPVDEVAVPITSKPYLAERAHILRSLIIRASAESGGTQLDNLPRQISNELLRRQMLWNELESAESELLSASTGSWPEELCGEALIWCEQLRLLRWISGLDRDLTPLAHFPVPDVHLVQELPDAAALADSSKWLTGLDARIERGIAVEYENRVLAELITRDMIPAIEELAQWAESQREAWKGDSADMLVGTHTIASLPDWDLQLFASVCVAREQYCSYLADQLDGGESSSFAQWKLRQFSEGSA